MYLDEHGNTGLMVRSAGVARNLKKHVRPEFVFSFFVCSYEWRKTTRRYTLDLFLIIHKFQEAEQEGLPSAGLDYLSSGLKCLFYYSSLLASGYHNTMRL
jgi:hypothetical protein